MTEAAPAPVVEQDEPAVGGEPQGMHFRRRRRRSELAGASEPAATPAGYQAPESAAVATTVVDRLDGDVRRHSVRTDTTQAVRVVPDDKAAAARPPVRSVSLSQGPSVDAAVAQSPMPPWMLDEVDEAPSPAPPVDAAEPEPASSPAAGPARPPASPPPARRIARLRRPPGWVALLAAGALVAGSAAFAVMALRGPAAAAVAVVQVVNDSDLSAGALPQTPDSAFVDRALAVMNSPALRAQVDTAIPGAAFEARRVGGSTAIEIQAYAATPATASNAARVVIEEYAIVWRQALSSRRDTDLADVRRQLAELQAPGAAQLAPEAVQRRLDALRDREVALTSLDPAAAAAVSVLSPPAATSPGWSVSWPLVVAAALAGALLGLVITALGLWRAAPRHVAGPQAMEWAPETRSAPADTGARPGVLRVIDVVEAVTAKRPGRHTSVMIVSDVDSIIGEDARDVARRIVEEAGPEVAVALGATHAAARRSTGDADDWGLATVLLPLMDIPRDDAVSQFRDELEQIVAGLSTPDQLIATLKRQGMNIIIAIPSSVVGIALWGLAALADEAVVVVPAGDGGPAGDARIATLVDVGLPVIGVVENPHA